MALDDRERNFEKALASQLCANGGAGLECPDAETLAAYHERMLSLAEVVALKSHIAACPSCQEILANLEITDAIPVDAENPEKVFAKTAARALSAVHASPVFSAPTEMAAPSAKNFAVREMPKPRPLLRWAVPAGAIAAGLLVWVAINNSWKASHQAKSAAVEMAENRRQGELVVGTPKPAEQVAAPSSKVQPNAGVNENGQVRLKQNEVAADVETKALGRTRAGAVVGGANAYPHGPALTQNQIQNQIQNNANMGQIAELSKNEPSVPSVQRVVPVPATVPQRAEQNSKIATAAPAPLPNSGDLDARKDSKQDPQKAATDEVDNFRVAAKEKKAADADQAQLGKTEHLQITGAYAATSLRDANAVNMQIVPTKDSRVFWIISKDGEVFRSEDAGKTNRKQNFGEGIKAIAGSAPDTKVCWVLADKGIALRTKDGGKHWEPSNVPAGVIFTIIEAQGALGATISDASGQIRYSTSDGGATWQLVSKR